MSHPPSSPAQMGAMGAQSTQDLASYYGQLGQPYPPSIVYGVPPPAPVVGYDSSGNQSVSQPVDHTHTGQMQAPGYFPQPPYEWSRAQMPRPADPMLYGRQPLIYSHEPQPVGYSSIPAGPVPLGMHYQVPSHGPPLLTAVPPQSMLHSVAPNHTAAVPSIPGPMYYVPQPAMPQIRFPDNFRDTRPLSETATPATMTGVPEAPSAQPPSAPSRELVLQSPSVKSQKSQTPSSAAGRKEASAVTSDESSSRGTPQTTFKPTLTKRNSNPKINKILSDSYSSLQFSLQDCPVQRSEDCLDETYLHFQKVLGIDTSRVDITARYEYTIENDLEKELFDLFVNKFSGFIDIFLPYEVFQKIISEISIYNESRMILDSIMCLSSLIYQRMHPNKINSMTPLKYYQRSVNSIRHHLNLMEVDNCPQGTLARCLVSTNLLCIYELFFIATDSTYVKGAGSILISILSKQSNTISLLKSSPFYSSCFWATFICDLIISLKLEAPCVYCPDRVWKTLDPVYFQDFDDYTPHLENQKYTGSEDCSISIAGSKKSIWWLHKILLLFSQIIIFSNLTDVITEQDFKSNRELQKWIAIKHNLEEYERNMPLYLEPLIYEPASEPNQFPTIFFKDERTASVSINLKLAKLCLHMALVKKVRVADISLLEPEIAKYPVDFRDTEARDVAGIMQTYDCNIKLWPVNIHALRQASKHIEVGSCAHEALKELTHRVVLFCQTRLSIPAVI